MKTFETDNKHKRQPSRISRGIRVAAVGVAASLAPVGAVQAASASQAHETLATATQSTEHYKTVDDAIVSQNREISRRIGEQKPIHFTNTLAYYHGPDKEHFYIENPLSVTVSIGSEDKKVHLIGYIEPKGGPTGPAIDMFEDKPSTTAVEHDNADPASIHHENSVVFPTLDGQAFDLDSPMNPVTGDFYTDNAGEPSLIGYQTEAKA